MANGYWNTSCIVRTVSRHGWGEYLEHGEQGLEKEEESDEAVEHFLHRAPYMVGQNPDVEHDETHAEYRRVDCHPEANNLIIDTSILRNLRYSKNIEHGDCIYPSLMKSFY